MVYRRILSSEYTNKYLSYLTDEQAPKGFVGYFKRLRKISSADSVFYSDNAVHPAHNRIPAYGWIRKGKEYPLKANYRVIQSRYRKIAIYIDVNISAASRQP
ncbi:MAG: hypothetical protein LBT46_08460 [Planctomycetaceae bacterium]|nr:hypothetical protein [Planctomycetaceae bacterium]